MRTHNRSSESRLKFDRAMQRRADRADEARRGIRAIEREQRARLVDQDPRASPEEIEARERAGLVADLAKFAPDPRRRKRLLRKAAEGTLPLGLKRSV